MEFIIITNNPKVYNFYKETDEIVFLQEKNLIEILEKINSYIIKGHKILSDPIISHIENSKNPFKTILISKLPTENNMSSLDIIGGVLQIAEKLPTPLPFSYDEAILEELKFVDLNLIINSIKELNQ
ncbi:GrdX family protein [Fusobacterium sp.]|uniref:GrdX family protein n=1 Tax=Fusobacterium sp. TaxID=68766 RepID=UPI00262928FE|nr:GrdX family protein [Fusobacterium sp.]